MLTNNSPEDRRETQSQEFLPSFIILFYPWYYSVFSCIVHYKDIKDLKRFDVKF